MKSLFALLMLCGLWVLSGCDSPTEYVADKLTVSQLAAQPGYSWLNQEVAKYTPDPANVQTIKDAYQNNPLTMYLFVNPSCSCTGTQKHFPRLVSTLRAAGIPDSAVIVYSMRNAATKHENSERFPVQALPTFYVARGSANVGSPIVPPSDTTFKVDSALATLVK